MENIVTQKFIESLEWRSFEEFCYLIFKSSNKWQVELNSFGADAGADIILKNKDTGKISTIVQCKAFNAKNVIKVKLVRELLGAMKDLGAQQGIFITTSSYTEDASELAKKNNIRVITTKDLLYLFSLFPLAKQQEIYDSIANSDYTTPVCASCGIKLVERIRSKGALKGKKFWGCPNFPKCRTSMNMRNSQFEKPQDEENGIVLEVNTTIDDKPTKTTYNFESQSEPILEDSLSNIHALQKFPERNTPNCITSLEIQRNTEKEPKYHRHEMELEVFTAIDEKPTETAYRFNLHSRNNITRN